jgi:single-strand DNA-binding protein
MSLNKAIIIGNVGNEPNVRYLEGASGNQKVATFSVATTERYKGRDGQNKENTEWHNIVAWRGLADLVEKYVGKGTQLYVEGRLRTRSWTDNAGTTKYTTEILADSIQLLGRKPDPAVQGARQMGQQTQQQQVQQPGLYDPHDDDLPF